MMWYFLIGWFVGIGLLEKDKEETGFWKSMGYFIIMAVAWPAQLAMMLDDIHGAITSNTDE